MRSSACNEPEVIRISSAVQSMPASAFSLADEELAQRSVALRSARSARRSTSVRPSRLEHGRGGGDQAVQRQTVGVVVSAGEIELHAPCPTRRGRRQARGQQRREIESCGIHGGLRVMCAGGGVPARGSALYTAHAREGNMARRSSPPVAPVQWAGRGRIALRHVSRAPAGDSASVIEGGNSDMTIRCKAAVLRTIGAPRPVRALETVVHRGDRARAAQARRAAGAHRRRGAVSLGSLRDQRRPPAPGAAGAGTRRLRRGRRGRLGHRRRARRRPRGVPVLGVVRPLPALSRRTAAGLRARARREGRRRADGRRQPHHQPERRAHRSPFGALLHGRVRGRRSRQRGRGRQATCRSPTRRCSAAPS